MGTHTAGNWSYDLFDGHASFCGENDGKKEYAFRIEPGTEIKQEEFLKTLDLIASAPELLEALKQTEKVFNVEEIDPMQAFIMIEKIRGIIAKAEGRA